MNLQRPQAFAGFLIVGLLALAGFAAFSATGARSAPPVDLPDDVSARVAGAVLGLDLGPDSEPADLGSQTTPAGSSEETSGEPGPGSTPQPNDELTTAPPLTAAPT